ncbi:hypothetical protein V6N12_051137 [Hibiscus sabdariffa]|uniref:Protein FAR1-RELATED SEQUENCE n=1 Tax=Hibiscus sabdariffa TaxID=183260 RepID=A0ABR2GEJ2_9ROSI
MNEDVSATTKSQLCRRLEFGEVVPSVGLMDNQISEQDKSLSEIDSYAKFAIPVHANLSDEIIPIVGTRIKDKREDVVKYHRPETRFGCLAVLKVSRFDGKFQITEFIADHTHALASPSKRMFLRSQRTINISQVAELEIADSSSSTKRKC